MSLQSIFSQFSAFGFSGSRESMPNHGAALRVVKHVPPSASIFVGCAGGVDEFFRMAYPEATVFNVADYGKGRGAFAARSIACVSSVVSAGGLWVCFPGNSCPASLMPSSRASKCFCGFGSGSWASLAFALGSGCACLVFLGSLPCPRGWGLSPVPCWHGWYFCPAAPAQLSLV